jgi:hypothetical protein
MHVSPPLSILFVGGNIGIGMEGWTALAKALSSKRNLKKIDIGKSLCCSEFSFIGSQWAILDLMKLFRGFSFSLHFSPRLSQSLLNSLPHFLFVSF